MITVYELKKLITLGCGFRLVRTYWCKLLQDRAEASFPKKKFRLPKETLPSVEWHSLNMNLLTWLKETKPKKSGSMCTSYYNIYSSRPKLTKRMQLVRFNKTFKDHFDCCQDGKLVQKQRSHSPILAPTLNKITKIGNLYRIQNRVVSLKGKGRKQRKTIRCMNRKVKRWTL